MPFKDRVHALGLGIGLGLFALPKTLYKIGRESPAKAAMDVLINFNISNVGVNNKPGR